MTTADRASGSGEGSGPRAGWPVRRTFSNAYKLRIVTEYYSLTEFGARGALLRREGLYQSHLEKWRKARDRGALGPLKTATSRNSSPADRSGTAVLSENRKLKEENARLAEELAKTKAVLEVVGKAHALLGILSESADKDTPARK